MAGPSRRLLVTVHLPGGSEACAESYPELGGPVVCSLSSGTHCGLQGPLSQLLWLERWGFYQSWSLLCGCAGLGLAPPHSPSVCLPHGGLSSCLHFIQSLVIIVEGWAPDQSVPRAGHEASPPCFFQGFPDDEACGEISVKLQVSVWAPG